MHTESTTSPSTTPQPGLLAKGAGSSGGSAPDTGGSSDRARGTRDKPFTVVLLTIYSVENAGIRYVSAALQRAGFETHIIFLKDWVHNRLTMPSDAEFDAAMKIIAEKKADLKKMREKAAARKAEFEAMMNAADGAGSALAQEIHSFRKLAAQRTKEADAKNAAERKKKRAEIIAMNKKYEAKMAETFKRQDEEMKKRLAEYKAHAEKDAVAQAAHAERTMLALKKALSGEHLKAPRRRRGEAEAEAEGDGEGGEEGDAMEPDGEGETPAKAAEETAAAR